MFKLGDLVRFKDDKKITYFVRDFTGNYVLVINIKYKNCKSEELLFVHSVYTNCESLVYTSGSFEQLSLF